MYVMDRERLRAHSPVQDCRAHDDEHDNDADSYIPTIRHHLQDNFLPPVHGSPSTPRRFRWRHTAADDYALSHGQPRPIRYEDACSVGRVGIGGEEDHVIG